MDATPRLKLDLRAQADDKGLKTEFGGSAMDSLRRLGVDAVDTAVVETQVSEHMEKAAEIRRIEHDIVKLSKRVEHLKVYIKQVSLVLSSSDVCSIPKTHYSDRKPRKRRQNCSNFSIEKMK